MRVQLGVCVCVCAIDKKLHGLIRATNLGTLCIKCYEGLGCWKRLDVQFKLVKIGGTSFVIED